MSNGSALGDGPQTELSWKPAIQEGGRRSQQKVVVGALMVLAVSCAAAGFVAGRLSGGYPTPHVGREVAVASHPTAAPPASVPRSGESEASPPSSPAASAVVILNPGTADVGQQEQAPRPASPDKQPSTDPGRTGGGKAGVSAERDYRALRDYMLTR